MNYHETLEYLYKATPAFEKQGAGAYKEGLSNTTALDCHFGSPHRHYPTIHIAGTNGKGSCSHTLAAILQCAGYRTGLYTSPHLVDFRERIRVNGIPISEERVVKFVEEERQFFEPLYPSFFELTTALAFKYFEEQGVDVAVIETGLGGRLDCTNIIRPLLSIITNIGFDHMQFLGNTLRAIAGEKAGIIKENTPCLIGEYCEETRPVFIQKAAEKHAPIFFADDFQNEEIPFELKGFCQKRNRETVLSAVSLLRKQLKIGDEAVRKGMAEVCELTGLEGRWQTVKERPLVICDTGHNLHGWQYLAPQIKETAELQRRKAGSGGGKQCSTLRIVFGMADDKDVSSVLDLFPKEAVCYFCQADTSRAISSERLLSIAKEKGLRGESFPSVASAYSKALSEAMEYDFVFVGGSSYVTGDLRAALRKAECHS